MGEVAKFIGYCVIVLFAIGLFARWEEQQEAGPPSQADCRILSVTQQEESYFVNDEFDYGFTVRTRLRNAGAQGQITITARLSTSEGNFEREQVRVFRANEEIELAYQFAEPSINATGIQGRILCSPSTPANQNP